MFELVIIWETGEKEVYAYSTEERAEQAGRDMIKAFGNQIAWKGTRKRRVNPPFLNIVQLVTRTNA